MVIAMEAETSSDQRPVIQASEILGKIERGEDVEYDGVIVEGDLNISGLELPTEFIDRTEFELQRRFSNKVKLIDSEIKITNSEIRGNVIFNDVRFHKDVSFMNIKREPDSKIVIIGTSRTLFKGIVNFRGDKFDKNINFVGVKFKHASFGGSVFGGDAKFNVSNFNMSIDFEGVRFQGNANFVSVKFGGGAHFWEAEFNGDANFAGAKFTGYPEEKTSFKGAEFNGGVNFGGAKFDRDADFRRVDFNGDANFAGAEFNGDVDFEESKFDGSADFDYLQFHQNVSFKNTKTGHPRSQEMICRIAKRKMEDLGNKNEADYYFYREMEAVRIQNGIRGIKKDIYQRPSNMNEWISLFRFKISQMPSKIKRFVFYDIFEYILIQRVFGYGVRPSNPAKAWLIVVFTLGFVYWIGSGVEKANNTLEWYEYFYFSIVTAATPGYAGYTPASGLYTLIAGAEAIFGTFMWAAFIATFARKWQR